MITNGDGSTVLVHKPSIHPERSIIFMKPQSKSLLHMKKNPPITFSWLKLL